MEETKMHLHDSHYTITKSGDVFSYRIKRRKLKTRITPQGYVTVSIFKNNKVYSHFIHRLLAVYFLNIKPNQQVNHKNGIKTDNRLENLECVTPSQNILHAYRTGLKSNKGMKHPMRKITEDIVRAIRSEYKVTGYNKTNSKELSERYGIHNDSVTRIAKRKLWGHLD
jgi:hypothetical protein